MADQLRSVAIAELPRSFARLRASYAPSQRGAAAPAKAERAMSPEERAWGLMPVSLYRAAVEKTLTRDWEPRFARLGIDARAAWGARSG
jgi:hypothetical protein